MDEVEYKCLVFDLGYVFVCVCVCVFYCVGLRVQMLTLTCRRLLAGDKICFLFSREEQWRQNARGSNVFSSSIRELFPGPYPIFYWLNTKESDWAIMKVLWNWGLCSTHRGGYRQHSILLHSLLKSFGATKTKKLGNAAGPVSHNKHFSVKTNSLCWLLSHDPLPDENNQHYSWLPV